ncbi:MAG: hypothetical protein RCG15_03330 [Candidatus Rickettsia vulgarisii]
MFLLLFYSHQAYSSFWSDAWDCIRDPCNCGQSDVTEIWNGAIKRTIKSDAICPPYNKRDGRDFDNCLIQFDPPKTFRFYLQHCAESTTENTYSSPKIRVRIQTCNSLACWSQVSTLDWNGQCVIWPGAVGLPLKRICARVAMAAIPPSNSNPAGVPADPGYTPGEHLNNVGYTIKDEKFLGVDGTYVTYDKPKLCAYSDPGLVNLISDSGVHLDPMDWNPTKQPLHKTDKTHPIIRVIIFLVETAGTATNIPALLGSLLDMIGTEKSPGLYVLQEILKAIGKVFEFFIDIVVGILKSIGSLNGSVDEGPEYRFGCVELPLGPYPPPFCPILKQSFSSPSVRPICSKKYKDITKDNWKKSYPEKYEDKNKIKDLFIQDSDTKCVVSKLSNNIVQNVVRISLDNFVPLCRDDQNPQLTDKCVEIKGLSLASIAHEESARRDTIKKCLPTQNDKCVNTKINFSCGVDSPYSCQDGFRIVYAQKIGGVSTISSYYDNDLQDCGSANANAQTTCQEIWGINTGEFIDVPLTFPEEQKQLVEALGTLKETVKLTDPNEIERSFNVSIARNDILDNTFDPNLRRDSKSICVAEDNQLVGCIDRILDGYSLKTYNCGASVGITCPDHDYFSPKFIAQIETDPVVEEGTNKIFKTATVVTPLAVNPPPTSGVTETLVNLAGFTFTSFMAYISDDRSEYVAMPFSGTKSMNPSSIYGIYKDNKAPYDANGRPDPNAIYLTGLEYVNGKYIQGATHGCLQLKNTDKCIPGISNNNCVLTNLSETDTIDCKIFKDKSLKLNLRICNSNDTDCGKTETISGIDIFKCNAPPPLSNEYNCYKNTRKPNVEVCKVTQDLNNRSMPAPSRGDIISGNDPVNHFTVKNNKDDNPTNYDEKMQAIRDKTSLEFGLCSEYPIPKCSATIEKDAEWPETKAGNIAKGTCKQGFVPISNKPLERYCLANAATPPKGTIAFDRLEADVGCQKNEGLKIVYDDSSSNFDKNKVKNTVTYDNTTNIGTIQLGDGTVGHLINTLRCANYQITIPDITKLEYFKVLGKSNFDDYLTIRVNNDIIMTLPGIQNLGYGNFADMKPQGSDLLLLVDLPNKWVEAPDIGRKYYFHEYFSNDDYDLIHTNRLVSGVNNVKICLGVVGGGSINIYMEYKLKD